jgi:nitrile hydratase accessory protein
MFEAPWQARAHAMAVLLIEHLGWDWDRFQFHLIAAIRGDGARPYWESWVCALNALVVESGVTADLHSQL